MRTALASVRDDQVDDAGSDAACKALDFVKWVCRPLLDECLSPEEADSVRIISVPVVDKCSLDILL